MADKNWTASGSFVITSSFDEGGRVDAVAEFTLRDNHSRPALGPVVYPANRLQPAAADVIKAEWEDALSRIGSMPGVTVNGLSFSGTVSNKHALRIQLELVEFLRDVAKWGRKWSRQMGRSTD